MKKILTTLFIVALTIAAYASTVTAQEGDIVEVAVANGNFTTLVAAVEAAGLVETLQGEGPFTVFAPTDDAFAALPDGTLDTLLADPSGQLTDILLYHVVAGEVPAADVVNLTSATTVGGADISISVQNGEVVLNDSVRVVMTDVEASNGVIHVIDAVLLPPAETPSTLPTTGAATDNLRYLLVAGLLMIVIGGGMVLLSRQTVLN